MARVTRYYSEEQMQRKLLIACIAAGSRTAWGRKHGFCQPFVGELISGRKAFTPRAAEALGFEQVVLYKEKK